MTGHDFSIQRSCMREVNGCCILTWPVGDQTVSSLRLHLDVDAASRLQWQDVRPVGVLIYLFPEAAALQGAGDQPAARERAGRCPRHIAKGRHGTPGAEWLQLLDVRASVSGVVDQHRAIAQTSIDVVTVVQTPAAAPHWLTSVVGLDHCVGEQTVTHTGSYKSRTQRHDIFCCRCVRVPGQFNGVVQCGRQQQTVVLSVETQTSDLFAVDGDILTRLHVDHAHLLHTAA